MLAHFWAVRGHHTRFCFLIFPRAPTCECYSKGQTKCGDWIKKLMRRCGIDKPGACHLFRHSCATDMHRGGADIRYVQEPSGARWTRRRRAWRVQAAASIKCSATPAWKRPRSTPMSISTPFALSTPAPIRMAQPTSGDRPKSASKSPPHRTTKAISLPIHTLDRYLPRST